MSLQQNEAVLEKAVEDFDYAISLRNFRLAKQVIMNLQEQGFDVAARALSLELATKSLNHSHEDLAWYKNWAEENEYDPRDEADKNYP